MNHNKVLTSVLALGVVSLAMADDNLANLPATKVSLPGELNFDIRAGFHKNIENRTYGTFDARYGIQPNWEVGARGAFAKTGFVPFTTLKTGGSDFEFFVRHSVEQLDYLTLSAGVSFPSTPAQNAPFFTYGASYSVPLSQVEGLSPMLHLNARGVARDKANMFGIGGGVSVPLQNGLEAFGDLSFLLTGNNTINSATGQKLRRAIWGAGIRYTPTGPEFQSMRMGFYALFGNGLGLTTGTSLTPALGERGAFQFGITFKGTL
jgi:hypothetical protein